MCLVMIRWLVYITVPAVKKGTTFVFLRDDSYCC